MKLKESDTVAEIFCLVVNTLEVGFCAAIWVARQKFFFACCQKQLVSNEIGCKPCDEHFAFDKCLGVE